MYPGVYRAAAARRTPDQDLRAAWLATEVGVVSHASAAWLWELLPTAPEPPELSVTRAPGHTRRPKG